jgi:pimeloyl-ACP methyl ester carboxylesterase
MYILVSFGVAALLICGYGQVAVVSATAKGDSAPPLWGDLRAGAYDVGFRSVFRYDSSRTWKSTRSYEGTISPDLEGRPIQVNIWYPASVDRSSKKMCFGDYVDQNAPMAFSKLNSIMEQRSRDDAIGSVPRSEIPALQSAEMNAYRDAPYAKGQFPVVLYFGGLSASINANAILAEYLASHGYPVASISLIGPSDEQTFQSRTADDLESSVRDMEFAWSLLQTEAHVDRTRVAVMGHSVGAIEAVNLGLRNGDVSAVVALDGTYGFQGLSTVLTHSYGYAPEKMRAAFLDLRRAQGAQGNEPLDLSVAESFRHSDRTFITIEKMHHRDFTSFAMVGAQFHAPLPTNYPLNGWNREIGRTFLIFLRLPGQQQLKL